MWYRIGQFVLKNRGILLFLLLSATVFMGWQASKVQLEYGFAKAVPTDNQKYLDYQEFKGRFGEDGNMMVVGVHDSLFFTAAHFLPYKQMLADIKNVKGVEAIISVPAAVGLRKDSLTEQLKSEQLFTDTTTSQ